MIQWFLNEKQFIPDDHKPTFFDIDFDALKQKGIKALLIDIDNTLIPYDQTLPSEALHRKFRQLKAEGFFIVLISNNHKPRIAHFSSALKLPFIYGAKKPMKRGFKKALKLLNTEKDNVMVIGDQLMTDVFGAKRMDLKVLWLKPIKKKTEKWYTKINRHLEKKMLGKIKRKHPEIYDNLNLGDR